MRSYFLLKNKKLAYNQKKEEKMTVKLPSTKSPIVKELANYHWLIYGSPKIGCWCKGVGDAGNLDTTCQGIDYNHFY